MSTYVVGRLVEYMKWYRAVVQSGTERYRVVQSGTENYEVERE